MSRSWLERIAVGFSLLVIVLAVWFWIRQVGDVIETLRLVSG